MDLSGTDQDKSIESDRNAMSPEKIGLIGDCCRVTIDLHAKNNPMMACSGCQQIIKTFDDRPSYERYLKFCGSRNREVQLGRHKGLLVVAFHAYSS